MTDYRMVYDSGSKLLKCAIADEMAKIVAIESVEKEVIQSEDGFQREWNHRSYWDNLVKLTKRTIESSKINPQDIKFITASSIRPSVVFTDNENNALFIGAQFDLRGIDYAEDVDEEFEEITGKTFYQSTGHHPSLLFLPARYRYFKEEKKDIFNKISQYLPEDSWILVKLGGEAHANVSSAAESGLFDLKTKFWHPAWEDILDFPDYFLPWPVLPGEIIGHVSEEISNVLGLSSETKLVAGLPDTHAALLGVQCLENGSIGAVLGSTTPVQIVTDQLHLGPDEKTWSGVFACKNLYEGYYLEANTGITGQLLKWAAKLFYENQSDGLKQSYKKLDKALEEYDRFEQRSTSEQINENIVFSLLGPAPLASSQTATTPGIFHFQSPGGVDEVSLNLNAFVAAVFDNIQFAITKNIEYTKEFTGISNSNHAIVGGITRNSILVQRFADLLQKQVITSTNFETSIQGLLVLCDVAAKRVSSIKDLKKRNESLQLLRIINPRESMNQKLTSRYQAWQNLFDQYVGA